MISIEHQRLTDLPAERVWDEMRHFDRVLNWVPRGDESTIRITGTGVGMVRDIELATMGYVQHTLLEFDDETRMFSYSLTGGKPLGMQEYAVVATVTPVDENHCTIGWVGKMTADDSLDEIEIGRALEMALGNMTTGIIAVVKGEAPDFSLQARVDY
jgi:polyketide cyclase/dehydrase/lipid transport protein